MRTFKKILLLPVKLLVLPLILLLKVVYILANLVTNIGTFAASPLILFVLGCGIYCAVVGAGCPVDTRSARTEAERRPVDRCRPARRDRGLHPPDHLRRDMADGIPAGHHGQPQRIPACMT